MSEYRSRQSEKRWFHSLSPDKAKAWFRSRAADIQARILICDIGETCDPEGARIMSRACRHLEDREREAVRVIQ